MFLELVMAAIVLALSINIISGAVMELKWISPLWALIVASISTVACMFYFVSRLFWARTHKHEFQGFIILNKKTNEVTYAPRYKYANHLHRYMTAAFTENAAIKTMWDKEPLGEDFHFEPETRSISRKKGKAHQLIVEATEYYVLEALSTHLTDYFNRPGFDKEKLLTFARNDIPDVLLSNRFLELFSKPMEDRPLFATEKSPSAIQEEVLMTMWKRGIFYSRFDLTLPKGARVRRTRDNEIIIYTDRFTLKISINFQGNAALIPPGYQKYILGIDHMESHDYEISVVYEVSLKFGALFLPGGWNYYRWIESFMQSFESSFSQAKHFSSIGWDSALTLIEFQERHKQPSSKEKEGQQAVECNG